MTKHLTGVVKSDKMTKSAVVRVDRFKVHPKYGKRTRAHTNYIVHNEVGAKEGNTVRIEETTPISKTKSWQITKIL